MGAPAGAARLPPLISGRPRRRALHRLGQRAHLPPRGRLHLGPVQARVVGFATLDVRGNGWSIQYAPAATTNNTPYGILSEASARLGFSLDHVTFQIPEGVFV